jgi:hypothetical protein
MVPLFGRPGKPPAAAPPRPFAELHEVSRVVFGRGVPLHARGFDVRAAMSIGGVPGRQNECGPPRTGECPYPPSFPGAAMPDVSRAQVVLELPRPT